MNVEKGIDILDTEKLIIGGIIRIEHPIKTSFFREVDQQKCGPSSPLTGPTRTDFVHD